jgi:hypothetical protein
MVNSLRIRGRPASMGLSTSLSRIMATGLWREPRTALPPLPRTRAASRSWPRRHATHPIDIFQGPKLARMSPVQQDWARNVR